MTAAATRFAAEVALIAAPLALLLWLSGAVPFPVAVVAMSVLATLVMAAGWLSLRSLAANDMPPAAAWVAGVFVSSLVVYALVACFDLLAATALAIWAGAVLGWAAYAGRHKPGVDRWHWRNALSLLLCAAATVLWCSDIAAVPRSLAADGVLATWTDQFLHGAVLSQYGDPRAAGRHAAELVDFPSPWYHYASYMLPAAFARPLELPGLILATSLWLPLGFLTLCAAAYALGDAMAGSLGGFGALAALTLLPDAGSYGLHNRLFGYYWHVIAFPGAAYALGISLLSLAFLARWLATRERRALAASAGLMAGSCLFRLHIFMLLLPAWLACVALSTPSIRRRLLAYLGGATLLFALFVWGFYRVFPGSHALYRFLDVAHNEQHPTVYRGLYPGLMALYGPEVAVPVGVLLVLVASVGVFGIFYPLALLLARRARPLAAIDAVPLVLLAGYLVLIITAPVPANHGVTEFTQRSFVLVYAALAIWTAAGFARWLALHGGIGRRQVWLPLLIGACAVVMWALLSTVRDSRWAYSYELAEGLPGAATFVRARSGPGDVLATNDVDINFVHRDVAVELVSMTGVPAYLARPFTWINPGGERAVTALARYDALRGIARAETTEAALAGLRSLGIRWYVFVDRDRRGPRWDPERRHAVFVDRVVAVYVTQ